MAAVLLKNMPIALHEQLKNEAFANRRSLNKEIIWRLELTLADTPKRKTLSDVIAVKTRKPITDEFVDFAKRWGRK